LKTVFIRAKLPEMGSSRKIISQRMAMNAAVAIRRDVNPSLLLSGRSFRNE
jgi:hypothetical protein